jgi:hypothetical protein
MARVKPSLFSAVSGVVGGVEFAMAKEGIVAKRRKPRRPFDSPAQIAAATVFYKRVSDWQAMTPEAMLEWTAWANTHPVKNRLGKTIYLTGYQWFMKLLGNNDGIHLPWGTAPMNLWGDTRCYEGGPYNIEIIWPSISGDDWSIEMYIETVNLSNPVGINYPRRYAGEYLKASCPTDFYAAFEALNIHLQKNVGYTLFARIHAPRYFKSAENVDVFLLENPLDWIWHYTMDDDAANTTVLDDFEHFNQVFEGTNPNTEDHHVAGVHGGALHFDGSTSRIILTPESYEVVLETGSPFTLCIWWKPDTPIGSTRRDFFSNYVLAEAGFRFDRKNSESRMMASFRYEGSLYGTSCTWDEDDVSDWTHYALTRDGRNVKTYRNGILKLDANNDGFQGDIFKSGKALSIGCQGGITNFAAGAADDAYMFARALTNTEIVALAVP